MFGETRYEVERNQRYCGIDIVSDNDTRPLVFLHGMFGGLSNFDPLLDELRGFSVFVPEIPLYEFESRQLSITALSEWLNSILRLRGLHKPILLGNSMGGHIALEYAVNYPDSLAGLVLTGSSGLFENDLGSTKPRRYDRNYIKERASMTFYEDLVDDRIIDEILEVLQSPDKLERLLRIARSTHKHNMEDQLHTIDHPVLLIWGKNDVITPPEVAERFLEKLPNARLQWIDRCGHAPMMERPLEFSGYLTDFLDQIEMKVEQSDEDNHEEDYSHF